MILTSSVAGGVGLPGSLYSATKFAVRRWARPSARADVADTPIKVTLIEPGMVDTPSSIPAPRARSRPDDVARAVMFAMTQPPHVDVNEILVRPVNQSG